MASFFKRRQKARAIESVPVELPVAILSSDATEPMRELTGDISVDDMFVATFSPLEPGTEVAFTIGHGALAVQGTGRVISCRLQDEGPDQPAGMLIKFSQLEADGRDQLQQIVDGYHQTEEAGSEEWEPLSDEIELPPVQAADSGRRRVWILAGVGLLGIVALGLVLGPRILGPRFGREEAPSPGAAARLAAQAVKDQSPDSRSRNSSGTSPAPQRLTNPPSFPDESTDTSDLEEPEGTQAVEGQSPHPGSRNSSGTISASNGQQSPDTPGPTSIPDRSEKFAGTSDDDTGLLASSREVEASNPLKPSKPVSSPESSDTPESNARADKSAGAAVVASRATRSTLDRIAAIRWRRLENRLVVIVEGNGPIDDYFRMRLENGPIREVIHLRGVDRPYREATIPIDGPELIRIRTGFHPEGERNELHLVFDLASSEVRLDPIEQHGNELHLHLSAP